MGFKVDIVKRNEQISEELQLMYAQLKVVWPALSRMAIALYEKESDVLHAFLKSPVDSTILNHYSEFLANVPSLSTIAESGTPRVIDSYSEQASQSKHTLELVEAGVKSSYTVPLYLGDDLLGFVFFDAVEEKYFSSNVVDNLAIYTRLIEALLVMEVLPVKTLIGMVTATKRITGFKDEETGRHIGRVAAYVELIATGLADELDLTDEYIEYLWLYAPLHDIGKIAVADKILLKPSKFNAEEYEEMKLHVTHGLTMIEQIINDFDFGHLHHMDYLKNMIGAHHERWDGKGYPYGLQGEEIPLEGRIMAVADVFDSLSSTRVYRKAFDLDYTFEHLEKGKGTHFDPRIVDVFVNQKDKVLAIYKRHKEMGL